MKKAQLSIEFMIILSILLIISLTVITVVNSRTSTLESKQREYFAKQVALQFSSEINTVYLAGNGFNKTVALPPTLRDGTEYNISTHPEAHIINIEWTHIDKRHYQVPIITGNINGTLGNLSGNVNLSNSLGKIQIN